MCNQLGQAYQINWVMHLRSDGRQTWLRNKFYSETLWGERWALHFSSPHSACLGISRLLLTALHVFSAMATRDSGQSNMSFSLSYQRDTLTPFVNCSPQTPSSRAGSKLCLQFNPSSPAWLLHASPGNHACFRREIERTVNIGCLMLKNLIT